MMRAKDLDDFFLSLRPELRQGRTCDGYKAGDPAMALTGIAVSWMANLNVIRTVIREGINCIITHEPIYYNHWDDRTDLADDLTVRAKLALIEEHKLVIYRVHDIWDAFPRYGVVDSWARLLGWHDETGFDGRLKSYRIPVSSLALLAGAIKNGMGLGSVRVYGPLDHAVSQVALGVGFWGQLMDVKAALKLKADCLVAGETNEWQAVSYARDAGLAMIVVGHAEAEKPGLRSLAGFLRERLPGIDVMFIDGGEVCLTI